VDGARRRADNARRFSEAVVCVDEGSCIASSSRSKPPPPRVLVVEDEDSIATLVQVMLVSDERVRFLGRAHDGREALTMAVLLDPDVILMDLEMPVLDGVEASRRLRARGSTACIIVHTGVANVERIEEAEEAGADAFVTKVPRGEKLVEAIVTESARRRKKS
jgi:CheY-like chemotaxis protein